MGVGKRSAVVTRNKEWPTHAPNEGRSFRSHDEMKYLNMILSLGLILIHTQMMSAETRSAYEVAAQASHQRMLAELDGIEERVHSENAYLSSSDIDDTRKKLASLPTDAPLETQGAVLGYLGYFYLCYGMNREAIETLEKARSLHSNDTDLSKNPQLRRIEGSLILAYLRMAENENCCASANSESCIFPIRNEAIHTKTKGAENALELLKRSIVTREPGEQVQYKEKWLANLTLLLLGRSQEEFPESWRMTFGNREENSSEFPEFKNVAPSAGIDTFGLSGGAIADDFDGDGIFDLIVSRWEPDQGMKSYRGNGDGTFEDVTEDSNLGDFRGGLNLKQVDFDNDGDLDIYVMRGAWLGESGRHPNSLLRNNGVGPEGVVSFTDVTFAIGLGDEHHPSQTSDWADFDLDGDLDLFVGNESNAEESPCQLFRNDGLNENGIPRFTNITAEAGLTTFGIVKGAVWGDYDGDRYPDLFLSCINARNQFWKNLGDGTFADLTVQTGTAEPIRSFPTWFWDYNNDGLLDLFVSDYSGTGDKIFLNSLGIFPRDSEICRLFQNDGRGGFLRVERAVGLDVPMLPMGSNFGDLMNDGYPDMYLGTGNPDISSIVPNLLLSNEKGKFVDRTFESRLGHLQKGHAVSMADFDRDGDLDIFEQMGGAFRCDPFYDALFENPGGTGHQWLSVKLKGTKSNSHGVGARVRVVVSEGGVERSMYQWMNSGGSFGANPLELHFGLATIDSLERVEVFWPTTGKTQTVEGLVPDTRILIEEEH